MKKFKKIIVGILSILLALVLIYNIYNFICIKILKKPFATVNGYTMLEVVSGSMEPIIHKGDLIIINTKDNNYQEKDIVTFYDNEGSLVTHRIIKLDDDEMVTKGDNNDTEDGSRSIKEIVGKYAFKINGGGKILASFKSPFTMVMILIIGVLVCIFLSIDENGNPILDDEEKEFQEYLKNKNDNKLDPEDKKLEKKKSDKKRRARKRRKRKKK